MVCLIKLPAIVVSETTSGGTGFAPRPFTPPGQGTVVDYATVMTTVIMSSILMKQTLTPMMTLNHH